MKAVAAPVCRTNINSRRAASSHTRNSSIDKKGGMKMEIAFVSMRRNINDWEVLSDVLQRVNTSTDTSINQIKAKRTMQANVMARTVKNVGKESMAMARQ